jgi:hypothetical protein
MRLSSEYPPFGRQSSATRTNGAGVAVGLARQFGEVPLEAGHREVGKGAHFRYRKAPLRGEQVGGQWRVLVLAKQDLQPSFPDFFGDMIRK